MNGNARDIPLATSSALFPLNANKYDAAVNPIVTKSKIAEPLNSGFFKLSSKVT